MPLLSSINTYMFYDCTSLISVDMPALSTVANDNFNGCTSLTTIDNLPLTSITGYRTFRNCASLSSVNLPHLTYIRSSGGGSDSIFCGCSNLMSVFMPNARTFEGQVFNNCINLKYVNIQNVSALPSYSFKDCSSLSAVVLSAYAGVPTVASLTSCPFSGIKNTVSVYIPDGMAESYRADENWAWLENNLCVQLVEC